MVKYTITRLRPKERLLIHLIEHRKPISIREASNSISLDYKNTYLLVKQLQNKLISQQKIGNTNLIKINLSPNKDLTFIEEKRTHNFLLKNPKISLIKKTIDEINYPFLIVLVFGSSVKKTNVQTSDIDLCVISDNKEISSELIKKISLFSIKLDIQEFSTKEFISMIEKKENNLGNEILKENIILYGIENYYNLISKWTKQE
jgi:predicted nucleotidyltransferase